MEARCVVWRRRRLRNPPFVHSPSRLPRRVPSFNFASHTFAHFPLNSHAFPSRGRLKDAPPTPSSARTYPQLHGEVSRRLCSCGEGFTLTQTEELSARSISPSFFGPRVNIKLRAGKMLSHAQLFGARTFTSFPSCRSSASASSSPSRALWRRDAPRGALGGTSSRRLRLASASSSTKQRTAIRSSIDAGLVSACPVAISGPLSDYYDAAVRRAHADPFVAYDNAPGRVVAA